MSDLRVSTIRTRKGDSPKLPDGAVVTGVTTATSFIGNLTGAVVGDVDGNISGTTGSFTGAVSGASGSFSSDVSIGGTITYEDVSAIDSVGVITARGGIKVGAGQSISAISGIVTYYGDGSQLSGVAAGVHNFIASGTIPNGSTVVINTDGTVGVVTISIPQGFGSATEFDSTVPSEMSTAYDSTNNKIVIAYIDTGNSNYGTAVVGTVSGTSISFGTPVVFASTTVKYPSATFDSTNGKVVIAYEDDDASDHGKAVVGTVSGTSISFGSAVTFESAAVSYIGSTFDSTNGKVVIVYTDDANNDYGTAIVGTVSGTSISFGSPTVYESADSLENVATFDSTNGKVVVVYRDSGNSNYGTAIVGTVSGTSISFGSATVFNSANSPSLSATFDSTNGKVVIAYRDYGSSQRGMAIVGTVSGTSISFGSEVQFNPAITYQNSLAFDSTNGKIVLAYRDYGNTDQVNAGTAIVGTVSGTSISFGSAIVFNDASQTTNISGIYDSTNDKVVIAYREQDGNTGQAIVYNVTGSSNLTSENYIGIAAESISNGASGRITVVTGVNEGQTGLTTGKKHYVQKNGSLSTTTDSPSVVAGKAISSTKIIVS